MLETSPCKYLKASIEEEKRKIGYMWQKRIESPSPDASPLQRSAEAQIPLLAVRCELCKSSSSVAFFKNPLGFKVAEEIDLQAEVIRC